MHPSSFTKQMLIDWGGEAVFHQAEQIVQRGSVLRAEMKGDIVSGIVLRPGMPEIKARFRLLREGKYIENLCPCPINRQSGVVCPHAVALALTLMLRHTDPERERKYREDARRAMRMARFTEADYIQRSRTGTPAEIGLCLQPNWLAEFMKGQVTVTLAILLGETLHTPQTLPRRQPLALSREDDLLLACLEDICEGPPSDRFEVSPADFINILDLCRHRPLQIIGRNEPLVVEREQVPVDIHVDIDRETGELLLYPEPALPNARDGDLPRFIIAGKTGYVYSHGHLWPMKALLPALYHTIYTSDVDIPRDRVITFLNQELPMLRKITPLTVELPPDLFERVPGKPRFRLAVRGSNAALRATLSATYGDQVIRAGDRSSQSDFAIPDPDDILRYRIRNLTAEKRAIEKLIDLGFWEDGDSFVIRDPRNVLNFMGSGYPALRRLGWKIEFTGKIAELESDMPIIYPIAHVRPKDKAWFDVGFSYEDNENNACPPSEIQRAINCGNSYLQWRGKTFFFDREAIESMRGIFSDCRSRESSQPGHFLLPTVYAPFVQSSFNAMEAIEVDDVPDWRDNAALRNRTGNTRLAPVPLGKLEGVLRPYQKSGVYWLRFLEESGLCGLLADEMGLGKTLQTLCWISLERVAEEARGKPALVVCPTSLVGNWAREAEKFLPELKCLVLSGPDRKQHFGEIPDADLVVTSYALIRRDQDAYAPYRFSIAILDEAQHIKNRSTQNALAAKQIRAVNRLVLTGTPIENSVADIWSIMDFLMPGYLGEYDLFKCNYEQPISVPGAQAEAAQEKLRRKLHPFILRRVKKDVAKDLPDKIVRVSYCPMTPDQQKVYNEILAESRRTIGNMVKEKGFERSRFEILAILMRLRQTACHLDLLKEHHKPGTYAEPSAKMEAFFELLDEAIDGGHRILVFSQFVSMLHLIRDELIARNIPFCYLDGSTQDRMEQCQRFNLTPTIPLFLISLKAGGTGLNLTGADMVVHFDPWWNPAVEDQATDRAHRIGQKRTVYSIKLIAENSVEERVLEMQRRKQAVIQATIGTTDNAVMEKLSFEDIKDLIGL
ncbi:MAG: SNF2 helicase associated domain-containing protein [Kiritimatiellae bacterium]|nr:SNF2 helicase associated domain-containing protein [Kiritimatiellia bacterium]